MGWLVEDVVHLSCAEEVSAGYVSYRAKSEDFSVHKPYQAKATPDGELSGRDKGCDHTAHPDRTDVNSSILLEHGGAGRQRKRKVFVIDAQRAAREHEAEQRHGKVHELLQRAHALFLQWLQKKQECHEQLETQQCSIIDHARTSLPNDFQGRLDLVSLSHMKQAIKPTFTVAAEDGNTQPMNLFDQLNRNDNDQEQIADAAGHTVLVPAKSKFLVSDITRLKPLLAGMCCHPLLIT